MVWLVGVGCPSGLFRLVLGSWSGRPWARTRPGRRRPRRAGRGDASGVLGVSVGERLVTVLLTVVVPEAADPGDGAAARRWASGRRRRRRWSWAARPVRRSG